MLSIWQGLITLFTVYVSWLHQYAFVKVQLSVRFGRWCLYPRQPRLTSLLSHTRRLLAVVPALPFPMGWSVPSGTRGWWGWGRAPRGSTKPEGVLAQYPYLVTLILRTHFTRRFTASFLF